MRSTTQIWVVTCNQYRISAVILGETSGGGFAECWVFFQASEATKILCKIIPSSSVVVVITELEVPEPTLLVANTLI